MYNLTGLMVFFALYFDVENVQKSSRKQYTENITLTHKERVEAGTVYSHISLWYLTLSCP